MSMDADRAAFFSHIRRSVAGFDWFCFGLHGNETPAGLDRFAVCNLVFALTDPRVGEAVSEALKPFVAALVADEVERQLSVLSQEQP